MLDEEVTRLLFIREEPVEADLAIVLSAQDETESTRRVNRAVQLYKEGYVPKLLLSGSGARLMAERADVPHDDLLIEAGSRNTFENMTLSCETLKQAGLFGQVRKILLVTAEWHMRRSFLSARRMFPEQVEFICVPPNEGCTRDTWTESEECRKQVLREMLLFQTFSDLGAL